MENKENNWKITPQVLALMLIIVVSVSFNVFQNYNATEDDIEYALTIDSLQRGRADAEAKADTAMMRFMIIDALLDSVKHAYPKFEENINNINNYYDAKIHGLDSLSSDSIQRLLSGK